MKTILILAASIFSLSSLAKIEKRHFSHLVKSSTEEGVQAKVERAIPLIRKGKIKSMSQIASHCWPNSRRTIKVLGVRTGKRYRVDSHDNLEPYFVGIISYVHKSCRQ